MALVRDWKMLPDDILDSILDHLISVEDCIRFSAVCRTWRSVAVEYFRQIRRISNRHDRLHQQQLPLLMFPADSNKKSNRRLYSVIQKRSFDFQLPDPYGVRFCGSSHGWLIMVDDTFKVNLFNPFSREIINLPPISSLASEERLIRQKILQENRDNDGEEEEEEEEEKEEFEKGELGEEYVEEEEEEEVVSGRSEYSIVKGVLSSDPRLNPDKYVLMVIHGSGQRLAFIKSGNQDWTYLDYCKISFMENYKEACGPNSSPHSPLDLLWHIQDIIFHNQQFYAVNFMGEVLSCLDLSNIEITEIRTKKMSLNHPFGKSYLVESLEGGDILRVLRVYNNESGVSMTEGFKVYKLVECDMRCKWVKAESLGNFALFLGDNHSISVLATDWPGCQPNSIYFCWDHIVCTHKRLKGRHDIGVFNLKDGKVVENYTLDDSRGPMIPPVWILPTFM